MKRWTPRLLVLGGLLMAATSSQALDWSGYWRAGPGLTSNSANRACYGLNGGSAGMKYRLGNECDIYGEFMLSQDYKKDGLAYKVSPMTSHHTPTPTPTARAWRWNNCGSNTLWLQVSQGSAGLNSNFGDLSAGSKISYGIKKNFKLVSELGLSQYKPEGGATARLTKFTIAPTLSIDNTFWSRPELRLYVTSAKWNSAAGNVTGNAAFANKTSGTSAGAQVEWWF